MAGQRRGNRILPEWQSGPESAISAPWLTSSLDGAVAQLNADYWQQAMQMTDVYDYMPAKRRDEWNEQIRNKQTPDFEEETVRTTLMDLPSSRHKFFGERVRWHLPESHLASMSQTSCRVSASG